MIAAVVAAVVLTHLGTHPLRPMGDSFAGSGYFQDRRVVQAWNELGIVDEIEGGPRFVTVPRHLDAMSYYDHGVKILRDVIIPAHTKGWEFDVPGARVYVPAACGNLSVVYVRRSVDAQKTSAPRVVVPVEQNSPAPLPSTTPGAQLTPSPIPESHHRCGWCWGLLLLPIALIHGGEPSSEPSSQPTPHSTATPTSKPTSTPTSAPTPTPVPTATPCPTKTPKPTPTPKPSCTPTPKP